MKENYNKYQEITSPELSLLSPIISWSCFERTGKFCMTSHKVYFIICFGQLIIKIRYIKSIYYCRFEASVCLKYIFY